MNRIIGAIRKIISISDTEIDGLLLNCYQKSYKKKEFLRTPGSIPNETYFINEGIIRVIVVDRYGTEHTIHFAMENQFIADYSSFLQKIPSAYSLQAISDTSVVVMPRSSIEWGYKNLEEGHQLGRAIAEYYFIYNDNRIRNIYTKTPKERYDEISKTFPEIHNRVPQHMIASYLGITPVHLSRLKKAEFSKL